MHRGARFARRGVLTLAVLVLAAALLPAGSAATAVTAAGSITGMVVDRDTGFGVAGAEVRVMGAGVDATVATSVGGTYALTGLPTVSGKKTPYYVLVSSVGGTDSQFYQWENEGYVRAPGATPTGSSTYIGLSNVQHVIAADLLGTCGGAVAGVVAVPSPTPMQGYVVHAVSTVDPDVKFSRAFAWGSLYSLALPPGSYRISFLAGIDFIFDDSFNTVSNGTRGESLFATTTPVVVTVKKSVVTNADGTFAYNPHAAHFTGRILGADGTPLPGADVTAYYLTSEGAWEPVDYGALDSDGDGEPDSMSMTAEATTRADGTFVLQLLGGTTYRFGVAPDDFPMYERPVNPQAAIQFYPHAAGLAESDGIALAAGTSAGGDWTLPYGVTLTGTLVDPLGHGIFATWGQYPVATAQRLSPATGQWEDMTRTFGSSTRFALRNLPEGTYRVGFMGQSGMPGFFYGPTNSTSVAATIAVPAVSQPTTIALAPSKYPGKVDSQISVTPFWPTIRRGATVRFTAKVKTGSLVVKGATLRIYRSRNGGRTWTRVKTVKTSASSGKYVYSFKAAAGAMLRFKYSGSSKIRGCDYWVPLSIR